MNAMPDAQLCHIGLYAFDLEKMVDFYSRIFGLVVTDRGYSTRGFDIAFLSRDPIEHHQIAIASGRPKDAVHSTINQISFRVPGLEDLRKYYPWLVKERGFDRSSATVFLGVCLLLGGLEIAQVSIGPRGGHAFGHHLYWNFDPWQAMKGGAQNLVSFGNAAQRSFESLSIQVPFEQHGTLDVERVTILLQ